VHIKKTHEKRAGPQGFASDRSDRSTVWSL